MTKRTEAETEKLVAEAQEAWKTAPQMPEEDARRLHDKWQRDSRSLNAGVVKDGSR